MTFDQFINTYNIKLNNQQEVAVKRINGPTLLLAVPGSGKTTVIVSRLGNMIYCHDINPSSILTVTYTVAATNDMRRRFALKFGKEYADITEFKTINSLCAGIIRHYEMTRNRTAFDLISSEGTITKIIKGLYFSIFSIYPSDNELKEISVKITYCKNMLLTDDEVKEIKIDGIDFYGIYKAYQEWLIENKKMDFDDQLIYAHTILKSCPQILQHYQEKYRYINVDEAQDTSKIQHNIIQLLASKNRNLFMVGDEDQSIYGFRAAYPQALLKFNEAFPEAEIIFMEKNYRSIKAIINSANAFIKKNINRYNKNMVTDNEQGSPIKHTVLRDYSEQYNYLLQTAIACDSETAVLYRNNDSAIPIIDLLNKKGIPYRCRQLDGLFFTHYVVKDITNIIKFAFEPNNSELFENIYYKFSCGIKKEVAKNAIKHHQTRPQKPLLDVLIELCKNNSELVKRIQTLKTNLDRIKSDDSYSAIKRIVKRMGYGDHLRFKNAEPTQLNIMYALAYQNTNINAFLRRIDEMNDIIKNGAEEESCNFILSTIHSSKGLEYDKVILIDVVDGIFPCVAEPEPGETLDDDEMATLEEERRLFYVGVTRAKNTLEIVSYKQLYGIPANAISSFVTSLIPSKPIKIKSEISLSKRKMTPKEANETILRTLVINSKIAHKTFGDGTIVKREGHIASVRFSEDNLKKIDLLACIQNNIIKSCK